jgi:putative membrane protein
MMADQQLAGLIMLTACPLTYVGASIVFVARWFANLSEERPGAASPCG